MTDHLLNALVRWGYTFSQDPVRLASGRKSNHLISCIPVMLMPGFRNIAGRKIANSFLGEDVPEAIAGVALGGIPLAEEVAQWLNLLPIYVRSSRDRYDRIVEFPPGLKGGARVLLVDDVVTTGASLIRAKTALEEAGFSVVSMACLVDRTGGTASFSVPFTSVYSLQEILDTSVESEI